MAHYLLYYTNVDKFIFIVNGNYLHLITPWPFIPLRQSPYWPGLQMLPPYFLFAITIAEFISRWFCKGQGRCMCEQYDFYALIERGVAQYRDGSYKPVYVQEVGQSKKVVPF